MYGIIGNEFIFIPDNCACHRVEVFSGSTPPWPNVLDNYSKKEEKVNGRYYYETDPVPGYYTHGIWWSISDMQWVIGRIDDKGTGTGQSYISQVL